MGIRTFLSSISGQSLARPLVSLSVLDRPYSFHWQRLIQLRARRFSALVVSLADPWISAPGFASTHTRGELSQNPGEGGRLATSFANTPAKSTFCGQVSVAS